MQDNINGAGGGPLEHAVAAAQDAVTDDMVTRLAQTAADGMDLVDQVNRSGLAKALPALAELVNNGDLDRIVRLARLYGSAEDALTDDMVSRLSEAMGEGLCTVDQFCRSGVARALPALAAMVESGDLERLAQLARVYASAQDAVTDDMVGRLAEAAAEGLTLLDRFNRGGADRLVGMLERMEASGSLERLVTTLPKLVDRLETLEVMLHAFDAAAIVTAKEKRTRGGLMGLLTMFRDRESQGALRYLLNIAKELRKQVDVPPKA